ncbi:MAG: class I SAM-dependent methyltransferase [Rhodospirillales bacterium]|nr:class I SAM-dependent methyltransferase [Rhodospirillales bacterium]MBO6787674.1 class I SAM-dependent methyltransferase [Rhodospirillales bacterium]
MSNYHAIKRETCRICGGSDLVRYLSLGEQPPSNAFIAASETAAEQRFPLDVYHCATCGLSQLLDVVAAEDIFDDYVYLSSTSRALCNHYQGMIDSIIALLQPPPDSLVIDVGCNDGITLNCYPKSTYRTLGVEPSSAGQYARERGFEIVERFFNEQCGRDIAASHGPAKIVTATNVFAHVDDIAGFAAGVRNVLDDDGVFVIEFPYLVDMIEELYFDTIYHEHLSYLSLAPLEHLFADVGLRAFRVERAEVGASGPALRLFVCRAEAGYETHQSISDMQAAEEAWGVGQIDAYERFAERVRETGDALVELMRGLKTNGAKIAAYGAPAKGNTLLNFIQADTSLIDVVAENNDLKIGKVTPGTHIPIVSDDEFLAGGYTHALLLAWNYLDFFLDKSPFIKDGGKFIVPVPTPVIRP